MPFNDIHVPTIIYLGEIPGRIVYVKLDCHICLYPLKFLNVLIACIYIYIYIYIYYKFIYIYIYIYINL